MRVTAERQRQRTLYRSDSIRDNNPKAQSMPRTGLSASVDREPALHGAPRTRPDPWHFL